MKWNPNQKLTNNKYEAKLLKEYVADDSEYWNNQEKDQGQEARFINLKFELGENDSLSDE
jgi:hypothetical protein